MVPSGITSPISTSLALSPATILSFSLQLQKTQTALKNSFPDTAYRPAAVLDVVILAPVAEALTPRKEVAELRRRPIPAGGIRTGFIEPTDDRAIREQHAQLVLGWHPPVPMAVRVKFRGIFL